MRAFARACVITRFPSCILHYIIVIARLSERRFKREYTDKSIQNVILLKTLVGRWLSNIVDNLLFLLITTKCYFYNTNHVIPLIRKYNACIIFVFLFFLISTLTPFLKKIQFFNFAINSTVSKKKMVTSNIIDIINRKNCILIL